VRCEVTQYKISLIRLSKTPDIVSRCVR